MNSRIPAQKESLFWSKMREFERQLLEEALIKSRGNITKTSRDLQLSLKTVHNKIADHNFLPAWISHLRQLPRTRPESE